MAEYIAKKALTKYKNDLMWSKEYNICLIINVTYIFANVHRNPKLNSTVIESGLLILKCVPNGDINEHTCIYDKVIEVRLLIAYVSWI